MSTGKDVYEENKRLKSENERLRDQIARDRDERNEKANVMGDKMADFFIALADGRVLLEQFNGNIPAWRIFVQPKEPQP